MLKEHEKGWSFSKDIMLLVKKIGKSGYIEPVRTSFRVSSLPYCPIYDLFQEKAAYQETEYSKSYYTKVGTAVHEAFQLHVEHLDPTIPYGDWECSRIIQEKEAGNLKTIKTCTKSVSHMTLKDAETAFKSAGCPHGNKNCHNHLKYRELELIYKKLLSGHTDMLFIYKGKIYLIDAKTTSNYIIKGNKPAPARTYQEQIETYAYILTKKYKVKIDYVVILYMGREKSISKYSTPVKIYAKKVDNRFLKKRQRITDHYVKLYKLRKSLGHPANLDSNKLDRIIDRRPCKSVEDYNALMKSKFEASRKDCPMLAFCTTRPKHIRQGLKGASL